MIELMKQWLEALESMKETLAEHNQPISFNEDKAITSLEQAIAEEEKQEPVAWGNLANWCLDSDRVLITDKEAAEKYHRDVYDLTPLYPHPQPKSEWVGLTDGELNRLYETHHDNFGHPISASQNGWSYERAIEARLKEKNNG